MILNREGDPDETPLGGGEQQRADGAVEQAVGDVEHAVLVGFLGQPGLQARHRLMVVPVGGSEQVCRAHRGSVRSSGPAGR